MTFNGVALAALLKAGDRTSNPNLNLAFCHNPTAV